MGDTLKVAVLGVGGIAGTHMPGWIASEDAEVIAGCDVNGEILKKWGAEHQVNKLYTDANQIWSDQEIDIGASRGILIDIVIGEKRHQPLDLTLNISIRGRGAQPEARGRCTAWDL